MNFKKLAVFFYDILQLVAAIVSIGGLYVYRDNLLACLEYIRPYSAYLIGGIITFMFIAIAFCSWYFLWYKKKVTNWDKMGYKVVGVEYLYKYDDDDYKKQCQTTRIVIKANKNGVNRYYARYVWTGKGTECAPVLLSALPNQSIQNVKHGIGGWSTYEVDLGKALKRGEEMELKIRQEFYDRQGVIRPMLEKQIADPIDKLTLRVLVSQKRLPVENSVCQEILDASTAIIYNEESNHLMMDEHTREIRWEIVKPKLHKVYRICWKWADEISSS
ncbi:hypothetical protein [Sporomusa malonica]|uniref:Uncharacterized protein n=1 Tax=Sporomusa malonica TaxID=112901 RepID=A0A1W2C5Z1_9FIRM|nr:hypothetical protein [Sporomusa malonica]SMC80677.1 hypothetical protein SAMN04488500_109177 [Sporomusa malonica]